jgi:hypothetical protein
MVLKAMAISNRVAPRLACAHQWGETSRRLRTINARAIGTLLANLPKATLPEKAEILPAASHHDD